jgi:hypothetical protein
LEELRTKNFKPSEAKPMAISLKRPVYLFWQVFDPIDAVVSRATTALSKHPVVATFNARGTVIRTKAWLRRHSSLLSRTACVALPVFTLMLSNQHPAAAYLFDTAQAAVDTAFPVSKTVVDMAFNAGRAVFGLYLLVSIFKVLHSIRQEEDWQAVAQTPAMVFIGVQLASLASTLIFP